MLEFFTTTALPGKNPASATMPSSNSQGCHRVLTSQEHLTVTSFNNP